MRNIAQITLIVAVVVLLASWVLTRRVFWVIPGGKACWTVPGFDGGTICGDGMLCPGGSNRCMVVKNGVVSAVRNPHR